MKLKLKQTATYWANPSNDGFNNYTFDSPAQVNVRWEDHQEKVVDENGIEIISKAKVFVDQDMESKEWLMLGTSSEVNPQSEETAFEIIKFEKVPSLKADEFVRVVYL